MTGKELFVSRVSTDSTLSDDSCTVFFGAASLGLGEFKLGLVRGEVVKAASHCNGISSSELAGADCEHAQAPMDIAGSFPGKIL